MQDDSHQAALSWLAVVLAGQVMPMYHEKNYWETQAQLLPHAEQCNKRIVETLRGNTEDQRARERVTDMENLISAAHCLGILYVDQEKLDEIEKMYVWALEGYEKALGAEHTSKLNTVNNSYNL